MVHDRKIKVGIGFATGRLSFQKVLKAYALNWKECGLTEMEDISLNLFVAYDLKYSSTRLFHYTNIRKDVRELLDNVHFLGSTYVQKETAGLISENVISKEEAALFFGSGYAAKRNTVLYAAIKSGMDYLLFLDDDEYPMAVTKTRHNAVWGGQHVLLMHINHIKNADITNGHHCGYISPIPYIRFNNKMTESDFRTFIEAISNDIINWNTIRSVMKNGGVTYADTGILTSEEAKEVPLSNHTKFISGSNLCINLKKPERVYPFYNPPNARGEDTFLSTCLGERKVMRIPCYTFHDGFCTYQHLMDGVLPTNLKYITADFEPIIERFYKACIGWVRYKPLLLYITQRDNYENAISEMRERLAHAIPKICDYFERPDFSNTLKELDHYHKNVKKHYRQFIETQEAWAKITAFINGSPCAQAL